MTLLFASGFEGAILTDWTGTVGNWSYGVVTGRFGSGFAANGSSGNDRTGPYKTITPTAQVTVGFARSSTFWGLNLCSLFADSGAVEHINLITNASGQVEIRRGNGVATLATSTGTIPLGGAYTYYEVQATISDTVGTVEVRVNGGTTAFVSYTGDTRNAGTSTNFDQVRIYGMGNASGLIDDIYICDGLGSVNNTFLGDVRIYGLSPTGAGSSTGLTPSTGSNWQTVDEIPASAADYSGSAVSGTRDTYAFSDLPASATNVKAIVLDTSMHKSDAGAASMKPAIRSGGTNYYGTTQALSASLIHYFDYWETDPATGVAWTTSGVNALEAGAEVV